VLQKVSDEIAGWVDGSNGRSHGDLVDRRKRIFEIEVARAAGFTHTLLLLMTGDQILKAVPAQK